MEPRPLSIAEFSGGYFSERYPLQLEHIACSDDVKALAELLQSDLECLNRTHDNQQSMLQVFLEQRAERCVKFILEKHIEKIDRAHVDASGRSVLHSACKAQSSVAVRALVNWGYDPLQRDHTGKVPILELFPNPSLDSLQFLLEFIKDKKYHEKLFPEGKQNLVHLAAASDIEVLERVLLLNCPLNSLDEEGRSALHYALESPSADANIRAIFNKGAELDVADQEGHTPFSLACQRRLIHFAKLLLHFGANAEAGRHSPLVDLFMQEETDLYSDLLQKGVRRGVDVINLFLKVMGSFDDGPNLVFQRIAANKGNRCVLPRSLNEIPTLLAQNPQSVEGNSYLHEYCIDTNKNIEVLKKSAPEGAWKIINHRGETPFLYTCRQSLLSRSLQVLLCDDVSCYSDLADNSCLHVSIGHKSLTQAFFMTKLFGWRLGLQHNIDKVLPIHLACKRGYYLVIRLLLSTEANAGLPDAAGNTPLHYLAENSDLREEEFKKIIALLLERGANLEAKNLLGHTPLAHAVQKGNRPLARALFSFKADAFYAQGEGNFFVQACVNEELSFVRELLPRGSRAIEGSLALSCVIARIERLVKSRQSVFGIYRVFLMLLDHGIEPGGEIRLSETIKTTPLLQATLANLTPVASRLISAGASLAEKDNLGVNLVEIAARKGFLPLVQLLVKSKAPFSDRLIKEPHIHAEIKPHLLQTAPPKLTLRRVLSFSAETGPTPTTEVRKSGSFVDLGANRPATTRGLQKVMSKLSLTPKKET